MRRIPSLILAILLLGVGFSTIPAAAQILEEKIEIVVELEPDQDPTASALFFVAQLDVPKDGQCLRADETLTPGTEPLCRINHVYSHAITGFSVYLTSFELKKAERLLNDNYGIRSIEVSQPINLPLVANSLSTVEGDTLSGTQVTPWGIERTGGGTVDGSSVAVAVIDTGVAPHPDLNIDTSLAYDCTDNVRTDGQPGWVDGHGHGTHVSGTIAALDNGIGVVGMAPGARIVPVKVLTDSGAGSWGSVICGIDYVVQHANEIPVANMSLGGGGTENACGEDDPMHNAICVLTERTVLAVAAGNSAQNIATFSPANYEEAFSVSAYTEYDGQPGGFGLMPAAGCSAMSIDDELATFSNYGNGVDATMPGVCVLSTLPPIEVNGVIVPQYGYFSGTSMASPHAAGCLAAYIAANPDQVDHAVEQVLMWSNAHKQPLNGDHDDVREPLLTCSNVPRWEGAK